MIAQDALRRRFFAKGCPRTRATVITMKKNTRPIKKITLLTLAILLISSCLGSCGGQDALNASAEDFMTMCTEYPSYAKLILSTDVAAMSLPANAEGNVNAVQTGTVNPGNELTSLALYKNPHSEYWYKIALENGKEAFIPADSANATMLFDPIEVANMLSPSALSAGENFRICGSVSSGRTFISYVRAAVYPHDRTFDAPVLESKEDVRGFEYTVNGSKLDSQTDFRKLDGGQYTYRLSVVTENNVANDGVLVSDTKETVVDSSALVISDQDSPNKKVAFGIDVSVWQGEIDWDKTAKEIDFAILRTSHGNPEKEGGVADQYFTRNADACTRLGIPFGVYVYTTAKNTAEAIDEAEYTLRTIKGYDLDLPVFLDLEYSEMTSLGKNAILDVAEAFCKTVEDAGYYTGIYANTTWFTNYLVSVKYNSRTLWHAAYYKDAYPENGSLSATATKNYGGTLRYGGGYTLWQFTSKGTVVGIKGNVDCNIWYGDFPGKRSDKTYIGACKRYDTDITISLTQNADLTFYPCTSDVRSESVILDTVSAGEKLNATALYLNPDGEYWYLVDRNGTFGYVRAEYATFAYADADGITTPKITLDVDSVGKLSLSGTLYSQNHAIDALHVSIISQNGERIFNADIKNGKLFATEYRLANSALERALKDASLPVGNYELRISADVTDHYADGGKLASVTTNIALAPIAFTVSE